MEWWHWTIGGIALTLLELLVPSFFVLWFGLGALLVAGIVWLWPALPFTAQLLFWIVASVLMVALWLRVFRPNARDNLAGSSGEIIGEAGLVVSRVEPFSAGRVRFQRPVLGSDEWPCLAEEALFVGERVRVVAIEGSYVRISRA